MGPPGMGSVALVQEGPGSSGELIAGTADRPRTVVSRTYVRLVTEAVDVVIDLVFPHRVAPPRLPVAWLTAVEKAAELARVQQRRAADTAYEAELIMGLAGQRPASDDPPPGSPGAH